jgi:hypothetical protein
MVDENIRTIFLLDETKPFAVIEPFYGTIGHTITSSFLKNSQSLKLEDVLSVIRKVLQQETAPPGLVRALLIDGTIPPLKLKIKYISRYELNFSIEFKSVFDFRYSN